MKLNSYSSDRRLAPVATFTTRQRSRFYGGADIRPYRLKDGRDFYELVIISDSTSDRRLRNTQLHTSNVPPRITVGRRARVRKIRLRENERERVRETQ